MEYGTYRKRKQKDLLRLLKEKEKADKKLEKEMKQRAENKYTTRYLVAVRKELTQKAMEIDDFEYRRMAEELKKNLPANDADKDNTEK